MALELTAANLRPSQEDELALQCRSGDPRAFDELVDRYQVRLFRFAYRMLRDRSEAEDAVQEAFVRAFRALGAYRPGGFFSSWIYRITLNECRRRLRGARTAVDIETVSNLSGGGDPQSAALGGERDRALHGAIGALPEHYRLVLILFYFEEFSVDQVSRALGVSVSAVKVRLHRGREKLASALAGRI